MRRLVLPIVLMVAVVALVYWLPEREPMPVADATYTEAPHAMVLAIEQQDATAPVRERWLLEYPSEPPASVRLVLDVREETGQEDGRPVFAATVAPAPDGGTGDATAFLERLGSLMRGVEGDVPARPPAPMLPCTATLLGEHLSQGTGVVGAQVIAGEFASNPPGNWKVYKLTFGEIGAELFLAVSDTGRTGLFLAKAPEYGPMLRAEFARLFPGAAAGRPETQP